MVELNKLAREPYQSDNKTTGTSSNSYAAKLQSNSSRAKRCLLAALAHPSSAFLLSAPCLSSSLPGCACMRMPALSRAPTVVRAPSRSPRCPSAPRVTRELRHRPCRWMMPGRQREHDATTATTRPASRPRGRGSAYSVSHARPASLVARACAAYSRTRMLRS